MQRLLTYLHSKLLSRRFEPSVESWKLQSSIEQICPRLHTAKVVLISIMRALTSDRYFKEMTQTMATQAANMTSHVSNLVEGSEETLQLEENIRKLEEILCHILIFVQSETQSTLLWMEDLCIQNRYYVLTAQLTEITQTFEKASAKSCQAEDQVNSSTCLNNPPFPMVVNRSSVFQGAHHLVFYGGNFSGNVFGEEANDTEGIVSGPSVIKVEDVSPQREIYKGEGYRLHSAEYLGKVVVIKVFEGNRTKERSSKEACFYRQVIHPNIPLMIGVSPLKSDSSFLVFDGGYDGPLDYILGQALKKDLRGSLIMGLETVVGLSSGLDYLHGLRYPVASIGLEHFVLLYSRGRITISFDPEGLDNISDLQLRNIDSALDLFHALCQKTFDAACKTHYEGQQIQRTESYINEDGMIVYEASTKDSNDIEHRGHEEVGEGEILDENASINLELPRNADLLSDMSSLVPSVAQDPSSVQRTSIQRKQGKLPPMRKPEQSSPSTGRRQELVWQIPAEENITLNQISREFQHFLKVNASSTKPHLDRRRGRYTKRTAHRCPGYNRIEITLTADITRSAIISHSTPIPHEICPVCKEVVQDAEIFNCMCGQEDNESIATVMCSQCSEWHHRPCVAVDFVDREPHKFVCKRCCQLSEGPITVFNEWTVPGKHLPLPVSPALEVNPQNPDRVTRFGTEKKTFLKRTWVKRLSDSVGTFIQSRQNGGPNSKPYIRGPASPAAQQLPPVSPGLPSRVDETLAACPRLRILVVGNSGVGKSSLVQSIFGIDPDMIDISHDHGGNTGIEWEYTSPENPRIILHKSQGFELGYYGNWAKAEDFLKTRQKNGLPGRIHAIWFCLETPLTSSRLLQRGDERMLELAKKFNIPIIAVFTKYDLLERMFYIENGRGFNADKLASESFNRSVRDLKAALPANISLSCVKASTRDSKENEYIINLTKVTREKLQNVEEELQVLWVVAQQVNARQKVDVSISEGFKKYWPHLGQSNAFEGQILIDCIHRLHDDVLKVWNFNDQTGILSGVKFLTEMIRLVEPFIDESSFGTTYFGTGFGTRGARLLLPLLRDFGLSDLTIRYLYNKYQQHPSTTKFLAAYIINLVLILHGVFTDTLTSDPPRALSEGVVFRIVERHKVDIGQETLDNIDLVPEFATHPEQVIKRVITQRLRWI